MNEKKPDNCYFCSSTDISISTTRNNFSYLRYQCPKCGDLEISHPSYEFYFNPTTKTKLPQENLNKISDFLSKHKRKDPFLITTARIEKMTGQK